MALNLKNPKTLRAIDELARLTGESKSDAVASAIEARLAEVLRQSARENPDPLEALLKDTAARMAAAGLGVGPDGEWTDPTDDLYDEYGLPR